MKQEVIAWLFGALSAGAFAWLALRASLLHRRAQRIQDRTMRSQPSEARSFFNNFSTRLKLEAGWRPADHRLIIIAIISLIISQVLSGIRLLS